MLTTLTESKNSAIIHFEHFHTKTDVTQTANTALQRYSDLKTITVKVPLQKFKK